MEIIGIVKVHDCTKEFEWRIDDFLSVPKNDPKYYSSPSFLFAGESWHLNIFPHGRSIHNSVGYVSLYLWREIHGRPKKLLYSFSLKTFEGKKTEELTGTQIFEDAGGQGCHKFCPRSKLSTKKSELMPFNTLTILCNLTVGSEADKQSDADGSKIGKCSYCKEDFDGNYISTHEEDCHAKPIECPKCKEKVDVRECFHHVCQMAKMKDEIKMDKCLYCKEDFKSDYISTHEQKCCAKPIECPKCKKEVDVRKCFQHECHLEKMEGTEKLASDLINIFRNGNHSDVTIQVKDEKFQLHRCILAGRNPFFNAMFNTEMKEKSTGVVTIDDCKPDAFRSFVYYVYTGKVDELSLENVCDLYKVADKYQEDQLKAACVCFMKDSMSVDTFCEFIVLALTHDEEDLLKNATDLFCRNVTKIIRSVKWQTFLKEYPTQANELNIKAFDYVMSSK